MDNLIDFPSDMVSRSAIPNLVEYHESNSYANPFHNIECPLMYRLGGYHPLLLDEVLNSRYKIMHRLGHGGYSTVWLAEDLQWKSRYSISGTRFVAVKVCTAEDHGREADTYRQIQVLPKPRGWLSGLLSYNPFRVRAQHSEFPLVVTMLDEFCVSGPNGLHRCIVTELLGPTVAAVKACPEIEGPNLLPIPVGKRAAVQCAKALASLHSKGIVHGDFHTGNIAFALSINMDSWSVDEVYEAFGGKPVRAPYEDVFFWMTDTRAPPPGSAWMPAYMVCTPPIECLWELCTKGANTPSVRILDLSESFRVDTRSALQRMPFTPRAFAAPEILLGLRSEVGLPIDIWALGCVIYQLLGDSNPFIEVSGRLNQYLGEILVLQGTRETMAYEFWRSFRVCGAVQAASHAYQAGWDMSWGEKLGHLRGNREDGGTQLTATEEAVLLTVIDATLAVEPQKRSGAETIVKIMPQEWEVASNQH